MGGSAGDRAHTDHRNSLVASFGVDSMKSRGEGHPADAVGLVVLIGKIATGEV